MAKKTKKDRNEKFEVLLTRLEEIVGKLEEGDLELEESLTAFEEGVRLSRKLNRILTEAKEKVELLVKDGQGELTSVPFSEDENRGGDDVPF